MEYKFVSTLKWYPKSNFIHENFLSLYTLDTDIVVSETCFLHFTFWDCRKIKLFQLSEKTSLYFNALKKRAAFEKKDLFGLLDELKIKHSSVLDPEGKFAKLKAKLKSKSKSKKSRKVLSKYMLLALWLYKSEKKRLAEKRNQKRKAKREVVL